MKRLLFTLRAGSHRGGVLRAGLVVAAIAVLGVGTAAAGLSGQYFNFPTNPLHPDVEGNAVFSGFVPGMVNSTLSGAFPTLTATGTANVHEFNWWSPTGADPMIPDFNRTDSNLNFGAFADQWFPLSNGTNGGYRAFSAKWSGSASVVSGGNYTFGATTDDDFWVFVDNSLVLDIGGIHAPLFKSNTIFLSAGSHKFDAFFAQRHTTQSELAMTQSEGIVYTPSSVPEPGGLLLLGAGLAGSALVLKRKS